MNLLVSTTADVKSNEWKAWEKICTTTVKDVPITKLSSFTTGTVTGDILYEVKNGVCYVNVLNIANTSIGLNFQLLNNILPKPKGTTVTGCVDDRTGALIGMVYIGYNSILYGHFYEANKGCYGSFSYPVAE